MPVDVLALIVEKRDGKHHTREQIRALVEGVASGAVPDYQVSAWLMAAFLRGLSDDETFALTDAMLASGEVLTMCSVTRAKVDKHSTGGVGDKLSLTVGPAVVACGLAVPMVSGRSLGHTGGTLDKLEAIPGYRTRLSIADFERIVADVGISIAGAGPRIAPADARLYAMRDVTGTVESVPLIVASILSKKLAEGIDAILFDVKVGGGAFMKDLEHAQRLADSLNAVASMAGKRASALITDMSEPIGMCIGNALEVREAIDVLRGAGPQDTVALTLALGKEMLALGGVGDGEADREARLRRALASGAALEVFRRMVGAHGGDVRVIDEPDRLPSAARRIGVAAPRDGIVQSIDAFALGRLGVSMGVGRARIDADVDPAAGIELAVRSGDSVRAGDTFAWLHTGADPVPGEWIAGVQGALLVGDRPVAARSLIIERRVPPSLVEVVAS